MPEATEQLGTRKRAKTKPKTADVILFFYAVAAGTSVPALVSRCTASCATCGSCGALLLGALPLVLFAFARNRLARAFRRLTAMFRKTGP